MVSLPFDLCTTRHTPFSSISIEYSATTSIRTRHIRHCFETDSQSTLASPSIRNQNRSKLWITILSLSLSFEKKTIVTEEHVVDHRLHTPSLSLSLSLNLIYVFHLEYLVEHRLPSWLINLVDERLEGRLPRKQARRDTALGIGCDHALAKTRPRFHRPRTSDLVT